MVKKQAAKATAKAAAKPEPAEKSFTMRHLWRMTLWAGSAAGAVLLAILTTLNTASSHRVASALTSWRDQPQAASPRVAEQAETRRLAQSVHSLAAENDRLKARLAAVEQSVDDITGSVTRQIEAVKARAANQWPADAPPVPMTPAVIASIVDPPMPATAMFAAPQSSTVAVHRAMPPAAAAAAPARTAPLQYGVDVGSALSIEVLRARWLGIRSAHAQLFEGLTPTATLREIPKSKRVELRLVVGPLASREAADRLCAALVPYRLFCKPTSFDRQHLALD